MWVNGLTKEENEKKNKNKKGDKQWLKLIDWLFFFTRLEIFFEHIRTPNNGRHVDPGIVLAIHSSSTVKTSKLGGTHVR